ncbi:MAG: LysR family transcriptional regulator [Candidatus Omnitrophica bacterium]|nr:LysR family transcriptional regulator [Candidatus Omnitrophota bacterium]
MVDLFFIKTFVSVAKTGSFRIAAEKNFITQPAVSGHIKVLEQQLNCKLFERRGKKTFLTASGEIFLTYAENLLKTYEEARLQIDLIHNRLSGSIKLAAIYSIGMHELKTFLQTFIKKYPYIHIDIEYHHSDDLYELISNRKVDFGLLAYPKKLPGINSQIFNHDRLVLIQSSKNKIFLKSKITLKELNHIKYVALSEKTPTGLIIRDYLRSYKIYPDIISEYDNIETIKSIVEIGMGCSIIPRNTLYQNLKDKTLEIIPVSGLKLQRPVAVIYPTGKIFTKAAESFFKALTKKDPVK